MDRCYIPGAPACRIYGCDEDKDFGKSLHFHQDLKKYHHQDYYFFAMQHILSIVLQQQERFLSVLEEIVEP